MDKITLNFQKTVTDSINKVTTDYTAAIKASATSLTTDYTKKITDANGKISTVSSVATQAADKISWLVRSGTSSSNFTITDHMISLVSSQIYIDADQVNMRSAITWNDLSRSVQNDIDAALDAADIAEQIADGTYRGGTFISGTTIYSPTITGGVITGGKFTNLAQGAYLQMSGGNYGDLRMYNSLGNEKFRIYDSGIEVSLGLAGATVMTYNPSSRNLHFDVNVTGLDTSSTAVWG